MSFRRPRSPSGDVTPEASSHPRKRRRSRFASASEQIAGPRDAEVSGSQLNPRNPPVQAPNVKCIIRPVDENPASVDVSARYGDEVDLSAIPVAPVSTLKINQQVARTKKIKQSLRVLEADLLETDPRKNAYFDPAIRTDARTRRSMKPVFKFVAEGSITLKAEDARQRSERRAADALFREAMAARAAKAGSLPPLPPLTEGATDSSRGDSRVPDIEWWDVPFVSRDFASKFSSCSDIVRVREDRVTAYVHHPVRIRPSKEERTLPVLPLMLTDKERKRLRRQRRLEKENERRELIAVGLMAPPPPKVKLSNLMRVLASESTADPTKVEADVRAQVAERLRKHEADNEARKRTKAELHEKAEQKAAQDREAGLFTSMYRMSSMQSAQHQFKVDMNARQLGLTGVVLLHSSCNLVVVEGGKKALRKYRRLLLRRIDWNLPSKSHDDAEQSSSLSQTGNHCVLVWEGPLSEAQFVGFRSLSMQTENSIRMFLRKRGMGGHFDSAMAIRMDDLTQGIRSVE